MSIRRPRVLVVFPCTVAHFAGNVARLGQLIELLRPRCEVHLLSLHEALGDRSALERKGLRPDHVGLQGHRRAEWLLRTAYRIAYVSNRVLVELLRVRRHYSFRVFDAVARIVVRCASLQGRYDAAVFNYAWTARGLSSVARTFVVDAHDVHADRHRRLGYRSWVSLAPHDERDRLRESAAVLALSDREHLQLSAGRAVRSILLPYLPAGSRETGRTPPRERVAVFLASAGPVNVGALLHAERIGILAVLRRAGYRLRLVGSICQTGVAETLTKRWAGLVEPVGVVPEVTSLLRGCSVGVNVCGPSTGIKIKTVDYLVAGLHVVATQHGSDPWLERCFPGRLTIVDELRPLSALEQDRLCALLDVLPGTEDDGCAARAASEISAAFQEVLDVLMSSSPA